MKKEGSSKSKKNYTQCIEEVQRPTECSPLYKSYAAATAAVTLKTLSGIQFLFAIGNLFFFVKSLTWLSRRIRGGVDWKIKYLHVLLCCVC